MFLNKDVQIEMGTISKAQTVESRVIHQSRFISDNYKKIVGLSTDGSRVGVIMEEEICFIRDSTNI